MLTIVFDLDGTLIDTAPDLIDTLNLVLAREGLPAMPLRRRAEADRRRRARHDRAGARSPKDAPPPGRDRSACSRLSSPTMPRISPTARGRFRNWRPRSNGLAADGHRLAVCTNKLEWLSVRLLHDAASSRRTSPRSAARTRSACKKPDPEVLRRTILRAGGEPARAIMIGDSGTDIRTARAATRAGHRGRLRLQRSADRNLRPDRIISAYGELPAAIAGVVGSGRRAEPALINLNEIDLGGRPRHRVGGVASCS